MTNDVRTSDVVVRDGSTVSLRAAQPGDAAALRPLLGAVAQEHLCDQFLPRLPVTGNPAAPATRTSIVAESGGRIVAFAGFCRDEERADRAAVAFAVSDVLQGHGLGTRMLERLAGIARDEGVDDVRRRRAGRQPRDARRLSRAPAST